MQARDMNEASTEERSIICPLILLRLAKATISTKGCLPPMVSTNRSWKHLTLNQARLFIDSRSCPARGIHTPEILDPALLLLVCNGSSLSPPLTRVVCFLDHLGCGGSRWSLHHDDCGYSDANRTAVLLAVEMLWDCSCSWVLYWTLSFLLLYNSRPGAGEACCKSLRMEGQGVCSQPALLHGKKQKAYVAI